MLLWSKDDLKQKYFLIRLTLILTVLFIGKDVTAMTRSQAMSNEELAKAFKKLEEKFEGDRTKYESTISDLQNELESFKNKVEEEQKSMNETLAIVSRLDHISRIGTSCSHIASLGNLESGIYFLDTDGEGKNAPYEVNLFHKKYIQCGPSMTS